MKKLSILAVEDGQNQREMLRDFLRKEGHIVGEAENGEQAVQRVREGHYDLILLDYRMPGMDGMQVLRAVKGMNPEIDIVIVTAEGTIDMAVEAMKAGALDYITKPIEFEELLLLVKRVAEGVAFGEERGGLIGREEAGRHRPAGLDDRVRDGVECGGQIRRTGVVDVDVHHARGPEV